MRRAIWERPLHDTVGWIQRHCFGGSAWTEHPPAASGVRLATAQDEGSCDQDNGFSRMLDPREPASTHWMWPDAGLWRLHGVRLVGTAGHVFYPDGSLWAPSASDARRRHTKIRPPIAFGERHVTSPCVHLCGANAENRGHFMIDTLPRLEALLALRPDAVRWLFLIPAGQARWQSKYFSFYGIQPEQLVEQGHGTTRVDELWIVPHLNGVDKLADPRWYRLIARRFVTGFESAPGTGPAVLVSRRTAPNKRILNEDRLLGLMRDVCGRVVATELVGMPLDEQADLFWKASVVVGGYGQGLTNCLFSRRSTVLVLTSAPFFKQPSWVRAFQQLAQIGGNRAACLLGCGSFIPNENYTVDEEGFADLLGRALRQPW